MRIFEPPSTRPAPPGDYRGSVVALGNFDGVHLGHRAVIGRAAARARELGTFAGVMTFEPYPAEFFRPDRAPARLSTRRHKFELLCEAGARCVFCVRFGRELASTGAVDFIREYLLKRLRVRHVVVGEDFRFGARRGGDVELLTRIGAESGFETTAVGDFAVDGARVSSTRIRAFLAHGRFADAERLLGRPFSWKAKVVRGDRRGRAWGFPTANFVIPRRSFPVHGVYLVRAAARDGLHEYGVANVGVRPTVGGSRMLVETHLLNFQGDLYGRTLEVTFLEKIRDERRFADFDALKAQIVRDVAFARARTREARAHG